MTLLTECRTCKAANPPMFLAMGDHPPANSFVRPDDTARVHPTYPLETQACLECGLIQVADQVPEGFFENYVYVPSGATLMHEHFAGLATVLAEKANGGLIVDIGCNDGLLLSACNERGCPTIGVDPAANLAEIAKTRGVEVDVGYFTAEWSEALFDRHGPAKAIVTTNTFNHIGDLHDFMGGVKRWLAPQGTFVIEVPWAKELLERNEFDTIYHEHVSEFSLLSIVKLCAAFDFVVTDVHRLAVHGGSIRVFIRHAEAAGQLQPIVGEMLAEERHAGMQSVETYHAFAERISAVRDQLHVMLADLKAKGMKVAGYGAPAKGNTLLNYFQIGPEFLDFLVDRNPLKQGLLSPGMMIPVRGVEAIAEDHPDVLLVLAWNFYDEIRQQQQAFVDGGGRFLVPLPEPTILN